MEKPYRFTIICQQTGEITGTNIEPSLRQVQTYVGGKLVQTKDVWEDTRYEARLRLYNYVTYKRNGMEVPTLKPFKDTEIGVSIPILNF